MIKTDQVEFNIEVSSSDATEEDIDWMTRQLLVDSAELKEGESAPKVSNGDPVTLGSIALVVLPAVLPKVADLIQGWSTWGQGRTVKFKGRGIEFESSPEELQKLFAALKKGNTKK